MATIGPSSVTRPYLEYAEAVALMVYASGETEQAAALGALNYQAARLPGLAG
jgi:hypothetical protein